MVMRRIGIGFAAAIALLCTAVVYSAPSASTRSFQAQEVSGLIGMPDASAMAAKLHQEGVQADVDKVAAVSSTAVGAAVSGAMASGQVVAAREGYEILRAPVGGAALRVASATS